MLLKVHERISTDLCFELFALVEVDRLAPSDIVRQGGGSLTRVDGVKITIVDLGGLLIVLILIVIIVVIILIIIVVVVVVVVVVIVIARHGCSTVGRGRAAGGDPQRATLVRVESRG
ncbi:BZ3500_MvSof-1268-A1-R1_Chr9g10418 [Microbotryum saponariae]|uniref:BZ3500_MvSof-1268-A1-R1_Chr9g10418 protein n=1 Tax=Microbotryum saponariae TaxID=289078 RepID=A0A2X0L0L3_9BASI|nr:BZ3501_MvSof-1269-A2-R1_Chr9g10168 [Microbotryum saponariae]SDA00061.1 BZ3500_MvSof-1268-A1-R1_Chr9g10418 [Microbotryum saponariae]